LIVCNTSPLLRVRAFIRSVIVSSIVCFLCFLGQFTFTSIEQFTKTFLIFPLHFIITINVLLYILVVLSDYISLFIARRCLYSAGNHPLRSLFLATFMGGITIISFNLFLWALLAIVMALLGTNRVPYYEAMQRLPRFIFYTLFYNHPELALEVSAPALAIHL